MGHILKISRFFDPVHPGRGQGLNPQISSADPTGERSQGIGITAGVGSQPYRTQIISGMLKKTKERAQRLFRHPAPADMSQCRGRVGYSEGLVQAAQSLIHISHQPLDFLFQQSNKIGWRGLIQGQFHQISCGHRAYLGGRVPVGGQSRGRRHFPQAR
jgi:hypothetical protein